MSTSDGLSEGLATIIRNHLEEQACTWLLNTAAEVNAPDNEQAFCLTFALIPRRTGKKTLSVTDAEEKQLQAARPGLEVREWGVDRLCRVWLLLQLDPSDRPRYRTRIENLFPQAEMNELIALYSALPVLAYPEDWKSRCAEGIRSNIGSVLEALMYHNPYPAEQLDEGAWNQLVLKAFFAEKEVTKITGLEDRMNPSLARTLFDYMEERRAAHRGVHPQIWRLVSPYLDETHLDGMGQLLSEGPEMERKAVALALRDSRSNRAADLLERHPAWKAATGRQEFSWETLSNEFNDKKQE